MNIEGDIPLFLRRSPGVDPTPLAIDLDTGLMVIEPRHGWAIVNLREVWLHRELLFFMIWRDVKVRYKQTVVGAAWAVLQPLLTMVVFSIIFGRLVGVPSDGIPYPVFAFAALLPWTFFAAALTRSGNSLVTSANLISKVYFPRIIVPTASVLSALVDFAIAFLVLLAMMVYFGLLPGVSLLALPVFLVIAILTATAFGIWLAALNVKYRDIGYIIPFLTQFWLFVTPVAYPSSIVPDRWQLVYGLNPMVGVVDGFRLSLLNQSNVSVPAIVVSTLVVVAILFTGLVYFQRVEDELADVV